MKLKYLIYIVGLTFTLSACTDNFVEWNTDTKNPSSVSAESMFANSTVTLFDFMSSTNVNVNNFRLYAQQWAQTTYPDESNYELVERSIPRRAWNDLYAGVIKDAKEAAILAADNADASAGQIATQGAVCEIIEIFATSVLVDLFGDVPYSEAFDSENIIPSYDDDAAIYMDLASRLDAALASLGSDMGGFASSDLIYGGDTGAWSKFANSLKLRMAVRMGDVNPGAAEAMAVSAAGGVFESSADDFEIVYQGSTPNTNPLWESLVESGRSDFICANTFADHLNALNDPRRDEFFTDLDADGNLVGGIYGSSNSYAGFSHAGASQVDPTFPGTIMDFTEVAFLLADANERGWAVGGDAETWYNIGVANSIMVDWGGSQADADDYLAQADVAYATAPGSWKEKIGMQKWVALYNRGFEAWSSWRMYDAPALNIAENSQSEVIKRYTYPTTEYSVNEASADAAGAAIGGDNIQTKVFWDAN